VPYLVNGELLTETRILAEEVRVRRDPQWQGIPNATERSKRIREAAEFSAIDIFLGFQPQPRSGWHTNSAP